MPMIVLGNMPSTHATPAPSIVARTQRRTGMEGAARSSTRPCAYPTSAPSSSVPSTTADAAVSTTDSAPWGEPTCGASQSPRPSVALSPSPSLQAFAMTQRA